MAGKKQAQPLDARDMMAFTVRPICTPQTNGEVAILVDALRIYATNPKLRAKVIQKQPDTGDIVNAYLARVSMALALISTSTIAPPKKTKAKRK